MNYIQEMPRFRPPSMTKTEERDYEIWCQIEEMEEKLLDIETDLILWEYDEEEAEIKKERAEVLRTQIDDLKGRLSYELF